MKWIKHDTDANQDAKLQNLLLDYGLEGYGLYWYCIELIAGKVDVNNITFELEHDARIIARNTGSTVQRVEEMMKYFVKIGLFECSNNTITCLKLAKRLDQSMTSNPVMREIIKNFKEVQGHDSVMISHDDVMQDKISIDQISLNNKNTIKREEKESKKAAFEKFWSTYDKKVGKSVCEKKFMKLKDCDIEKILLVVGDYVKSTPDAKYRKNPQTWLNQECWNDEIINQSTGAWNEEVNARTYESGMSSAQRKILAARQLRDAAQGRSPMGFNGEFVHGQMDTQERRSAIIDMDGGNFSA